MARKIKKTEMAGAAAGLQFLGLVFMVAGVFLGTVGLVTLGVLGLLLLIYGGLKANVHKCSDCMATVEKEARICRHCRAEFKD